jgi:hypothetical protein
VTIDPPTLALLQSSLVLLGTLSAAILTTIFTQRGQRKLEELRAEQARRINRRERLREAYEAMVLAAWEMRLAIGVRAFQVDECGGIILDAEGDTRLNGELATFHQAVRKYKFALILDDPGIVNTLDRYQVYATIASDPHFSIPPSERLSKESARAFLNRSQQLLDDCINQLVARAKTQMDELDMPPTTASQRHRTWRIRLPIWKGRT